MPAFVCQICFEQCERRLPLPRLATLNGDVVRAGDCLHPICEQCMAYHIAARVEEQRAFGVRCPALGCECELQEQDMRRLQHVGLLPQAVADRFAEIRKRDYTARADCLAHSGEGDAPVDVALLTWLWCNTRRCPRCSVIVQKASGCNDFGCLCGHRFNFSTAPRPIGDGIEDFQPVLELMQESGIQLRAACETVRRATAKGIHSYSRVLSLMRSMKMSVDVAELHAQAFFGVPSALQHLEQERLSRRRTRKEELLRSRLGLSLEEARALLEQAASGDAAAWARIREARQGG